MCGLVGMVLKTQSGANSFDMNLFNDLLYIDALRGGDSTGVIAFHNNGDMNVIKDASEASVFLKTKEWKSLHTKAIYNGKALIGHNRKKTIGAVSDEAAHPFLIDDMRYAFVHNGTLQNHDKLHKTEVDSEALGMHLCAAEGDPKALEEALNLVQGAYACMWVDQQKEKLYLLRNKERPLYLANTSTGYIIASEYGFIAAACLRNKLEFKDCKRIDEHTLYTIDLDTHTIAIKEDKLEVKKYVPFHTTKGSALGNGGAKGFGTKPSSFCQGDVSKNSFKRIRKEYIGKRWAFWMDDYLPHTADGVAGEKWIVWGVDESLEFEHKFQGTMKGVGEAELVCKSDETVLVGNIGDVLYDAKTKGVTFVMDGLNYASSSNNVVALH